MIECRCGADFGAEKGIEYIMKFTTTCHHFSWWSYGLELRAHFISVVIPEDTMQFLALFGCRARLFGKWCQSFHKTVWIYLVLLSGSSWAADLAALAVCFASFASKPASRLKASRAPFASVAFWVSILSFRQ